MTAGAGRSGWVLAVLACALLVGVGPSATAEIGARRAYPGPAFPDGLRAAPTAFDQQSKLWFHDDAWWALMFDADQGVVRIHELMADHTWRARSAVLANSPSSGGDALAVGDTLYVAQRTTDTQLWLVRLTYDPAAREYRTDTGFPVAVTRGGSEMVTVARDTTGALWISLTSSSQALVVVSRDGGLTWSAPFPPGGASAAVGRGEVSAVVAFDSHVGVMWSDQGGGAFRFGVHADGAPLDEWRVETALQGAGMADDHVNLKVAPGEPDRVFAAVKTSQGDNGEGADAPLIVVLARSPDGTWSSHVAGTVADDQSRPMLLVDSASETLYLFANDPQRRGSVVYKSAELDDLTFPAGGGSVFLQGAHGGITDATGSKHPVDGRTGVVVLASDIADGRYQHVEMAVIAPDGRTSARATQDTAPPDAPTELAVRATEGGAVSLVWSPATDGERWAAAADGAPVREYTVYRDGVAVGTTTVPSFGDAPGAGRVVSYAVDAVDMAGNRSGRSGAVSLQVPSQTSAAARLADLLGAAWPSTAVLGLVVPASAALLVYRRLHSRRRRRVQALHRAPAPSGQAVTPPGHRPDHRSPEHRADHAHGRHRRPGA